MTIDFEALKAPFPPDRISWRVGSTNKEKTKGMALAYIDARDVMERLDQVCTPAGWQNAYPHAQGKTVCAIGIKADETTWVWKSDGAGDTDFEADKGALSDAFKRAAVRWGIGRYLYDLSAPWVDIEAFGNPSKPSYRIKDDQMAKLERLLVATKAAPAVSEVAAMNAINACTSREQITALLTREKDTFSALPNGGSDRVRARANERLTVEFPKPKLKEAS